MAITNLYWSNAILSARQQAGQQRLWLSQSPNRDYFRGGENVRRVQQWRKDPSGLLEKESGPIGAGSSGCVAVTYQEQSSCNAIPEV